MSVVLTGVYATTRRHYVGCRIDRFALRKTLVEYLAYLGNNGWGPENLTQAFLEDMPRVNFIEELEENGSEENVFDALIASVDHFPQQELTHAIGSSICICELEGL
jgi:hypothetical protein